MPTLVANVVDSMTDGWTYSLTLAMRGGHVKFLPMVRRSSVTDRWKNARRTNGKIMLLSHTLTMRDTDVVSFVEFHPREDSVTDRLTDDGCNNVALVHPYHERT